MQRRQFIQQTTTFGLALGLGVRGWARSGNPVVVGHGDFRYKIDTHWCKADPTVHPVLDCHEMVLDSKGRIVMCTNETKNNILIFNKDGEVLEAFGNEYPGAHGLTLFDEGGTEYLWLTDYERHEVIKMDMKGRVVLTLGWPADTGKYQRKEDFRPTETSIAPNGDVFVVDGYGMDYVIHYSPQGHLKNIFGGKGQAGEPGKLNNAHGIAFDNRNPQQPVLLVTSRADNALKRFALDGSFLESIPLPGAYICRPVVKGNEVYFAVLISKLPWDSGSGFVCILDKNNKVVSLPGGCEPQYDAAGKLGTMYQTIRLFKHPHDVLIDDDDNLYVAQWNSGRVYPVRLERTHL